MALKRAEAWILRRQEADGCWGGIQPPWVFSILALSVLGYETDHPTIAKALAGFESFSIHEADEIRVEGCQSPIWDTSLAMIALCDAGLGPDQEALTKAAEWLLGQEIQVRGDWAIKRPKLRPSGWAFEFANSNYPDVDDTAVVALALARTSGTNPLASAATIERALEWIAGMQCRDGGWGAFDAENHSKWVNKLSVSDFGEVTDPPSSDVTGHAIETLALLKAAPTSIEAGVNWLWANQEADGSWFGRWGANHIYGTGAVLPALAAAGYDSDDPRIVKAVNWLFEHQNPDGGWGEDMRSYVDAAWRGRGNSTPSQTAWALLALMSVGETAQACKAGIDYLIRTQLPGGGWNEPEYTGTGFPGDFYINYELYRIIFPIMALGRWQVAKST